MHIQECRVDIQECRVDLQEGLHAGARAIQKHNGTYGISA